MGWTSTHHPKGQPLPEFFYGEKVGSEHGVDRYERKWGDSLEVTEVAASALVGMTEFYAVIRYKNRQTDGQWVGWFGAVYRVAWQKDGTSNFGYRDEEESMGPCIHRAPAALLDTLERLVPLPALGPQVEAELAALAVREEEAGSYETRREITARIHALDPHRRARAWRAECRAHHARVGRVRALQTGDQIRFAAPVRFRDGAELSTFTVLREGRKVYLTQGGGLYSVSDLETRAWGVVEETPAAVPEPMPMLLGET